MFRRHHHFGILLAIPHLGHNVKATYDNNIFDTTSTQPSSFSPSSAQAPLMRLRVHPTRRNSPMEYPLGVRELFYAPQFDIYQNDGINDVIIPPFLLFENLLKELEQCDDKTHATNANRVLTRIHGNGHTASTRYDNRRSETEQCMPPTLRLIQRQVVDFFGISTDTAARRISSRINLFTDDDAKPFHSDAHAFADTPGRRGGVQHLQNFTAVLNLLPESDPRCRRRTLAFQEGGLLKRIAHGLDPNAEHEPPSLPQHRGGGSIGIALDSGSLVGFGRELNILWRHGVLPMKSRSGGGDNNNSCRDAEPQIQKTSRISIAIMGWADQVEED